MRWCVLPHIVNVLPASRMKGEMAKLSLLTIVVNGKGASFQNDVGVLELPADPVTPRLELTVSGPRQQPLPGGKRRVDVRLAGRSAARHGRCRLVTR